jgi:hypothetical protein
LLPLLKNKTNFEVIYSYLTTLGIKMRYGSAKQF